MSDVRSLLAQNMKKYRKMLRLSQAELAEKVGCSTILIANIEIKKRFPSPDNLNRIACALKVHPAYLFSEDAALFCAMQEKSDLRLKLQSKINDAIFEVLS